MQNCSSSVHPFLRFLPLVLLSHVAACSSPLAAGTEAEASDDVDVASVSAALSVDLTPSAASALDQRNTLGGQWGIDKVLDGNLSTKMFFHHEDNWIRYQLAGPSVVTRYELSRSADDYPDRVPTAWTLEASQDGVVWLELDRRDNQVLGAPSSFSVANTTAYPYYRLYVRDNHTSANGDTELAEFRIFGDGPTGTVPGTVSNVSASVNSNAITVSFSAAPNATSYFVQRIGDDATSVVETSTTALSFTDTNLAPGTTYVYQVQAVNGGRRGPVSTSRATATTAFAARGLKDLTALSAIAPIEENGTTTGPESVSMVTDNNPYTKWYQSDGNTWLLQQVPTGSVVTQYSLTSGNDFPERDPRSWTLEGSNDGSTFTAIDSRSQQAFLTRHQTRIFTCNPDRVAYSHYRLTIHSTQRPVPSDTQLAEWRLFGTTSASLAAPAAPSGLALNTFSYHQDPDDNASPLVSGNVVTSNQVGLKFVDNAGKLNPESAYVLERSTSSAFASVVAKTVGPNSTAAKVVGLAPNTTYYFRIKALNAAGSSAYSAPVQVTTAAENTPPNPWHEGGWYGHKSRNLQLGEVDDTNKVRIWFDDQVPNFTNIHWITPVMGAVWKRVTDNYGSLSDPYLNVVANTPGPGYGGGGAANLYDPRTGFRNVPWVAADGWQSVAWTDWDNLWKVHALTHETAHIVEAVNVNGGYAGAPSVWEDSWWAWIFQYDVYKNLPAVFPDVFERWRAEGNVSRGDNGWYWARDWLIPIYEGQFGNTLPANQGIQFLVKYFQLQAQNLPTLNDDYAPRPFTLGDYVHLCSGAAGVDLAPQARLAFLGWGPREELWLARAQADMPAVSALYRGNLAPGFTLDPIVRPASLDTPLSGQTLAGSAADPNPNDTLKFSKVSGPAWLSVASDGTLAGTPTATGPVSAIVQVSDAGGLTDTGTLTLNVGGPSGGSPCSDLCSNPVGFSGPNYNSGNLGTGATCHQTSANLAGIVCGNFSSPRTLSVNGVVVTCNNQNIVPPAKRNGGYCVQATPGNPSYAYFATF